MSHKPDAWETILYRREGPVAWISLNRPEKHNAQSMRLIQELDEAVSRAEADPAIHVIVIKGEGKSFSAGHDLNENVSDPEIVAQRSSVEGRAELERRMYVEKCLAIRNVSKPTIAQVHGNCIAAGLMLASMCDLIVASDDARFSNPVIRMGAAGVELPVELWELGARRAKELLFTGEPISAQQANEWGLINRVVPRDRLEQETAALAEKIAQMPPVTLRLTKAAINQSENLMGRAAIDTHYFAVHLSAHGTDEARTILEERRRIGDVKQWVRQRDGLEPRESGEPSAS